VIAADGVEEAAMASKSAQKKTTASEQRDPARPCAACYSAQVVRSPGQFAKLSRVLVILAQARISDPGEQQTS
jgi:hypothetical protein